MDREYGTQEFRAKRALAQERAKLLSPVTYVCTYCGANMPELTRPPHAQEAPGTVGKAVCSLPVCQEKMLAEGIAQQRAADHFARRGFYGPGAPK